MALHAGPSGLHSVREPVQVVDGVRAGLIQTLAFLHVHVPLIIRPARVVLIVPEGSGVAFRVQGSVSHGLARASGKFSGFGVEGPREIFRFRGWGGVGGLREVFGIRSWGSQGSFRDSGLGVPGSFRDSELGVSGKFSGFGVGGHVSHGWSAWMGLLSGASTAIDPNMPEGGGESERARARNRVTSLVRKRNPPRTLGVVLLEGPRRGVFVSHERGTPVERDRENLP